MVKATDGEDDILAAVEGAHGRSKAASAASASQLGSGVVNFLDDPRPQNDEDKVANGSNPKKNDPTGFDNNPDFTNLDLYVYKILNYVYCFCFSFNQIFIVFATLNVRSSKYEKNDESEIKGVTDPVKLEEMKVCVCMA